MRVFKKNNKIYFEVPAFEQRYNPYSDDYFGSYPTLTAIIDREENKMGWAWTIDMDYKGKTDQFSNIVREWPGSKEEFIKINKDLSLAVVTI